MQTRTLPFGAEMDLVFKHSEGNRKCSSTERAGGEGGRQTDRQAGRQAGRQADRQTEKVCVCVCVCARAHVKH